MSEGVHVLGIRHHGPGSARSLLRSLEALQPDIVLLEGPPDADGISKLASVPEMSPPVAVLVYAQENPGNAVFFPFAEFSPEWSALLYAYSHGIPVRFIDLPQTNQMAMEAERSGTDAAAKSPPRPDPFGFLAETAGYSDSERWWENIVEHRRDDFEVFAAILEGMSALRDVSPIEDDEIEIRREAYMRQCIRKARAELFENIAVVCGAWHAPALTQLPTAKSDASLLNGLPKIKVSSTWIPWTYNRLSYRSGYGAGIESPGWYEHLWRCTDDVAVRWMSKVGALLRLQDQPASSAQVIDAVRLAESLATLRNRSLPSLSDMNQSAQTIFTFGSGVPMKLIEEKLTIGDRMGSVPLETPVVPLQNDLQKQMKTLRLSAESGERLLDLDLRKASDLAKSHLLHRLDLLGIHWGIEQKAHRVKGTFHELWKLSWKPEFAVAVIEASLWGNTIEEASAKRVINDANDLAELPLITGLLQKVILASLADPIAMLMARLEEMSAVINDVEQLMDCLPALVNIVRYGNVRNTDATLLAEVINGLVARISIGLPPSCANLDDDAAEIMFKCIRNTQDSIALSQNEQHMAEWIDAVRHVASQKDIHGLVAGRSCRILLDAGAQTREQSSSALELALNGAVEPAQAANWVEGFLQESGQLLVLDQGLRDVIDKWVCELNPESFRTILPLLRRTFSTFSLPERKQIGESIIVSRTGSKTNELIDSYRFDKILAEKSLLLSLRLLGRSNASA